jgi:hypothetical protein
MSNPSPKNKYLEKEQAGTSTVAKEKLPKRVTKRETLKQFLLRQQRQLNALRQDCPILGDSIVLLTYDGPKLLDAPKDFGSVRSVVNSCIPFIPSSPNHAPPGMKTLNCTLGDHLFHLRDKLSGLIANLNLIDPIGDGNCGYYALQLFGAFLLQGGLELPNGKQVREAVKEHMKMRQFVKDYLTENLDYFLQSEGMVLCQRPDGVLDMDWRNGGSEIVQTLLLEDLKIESQDNEDSLLNSTILKPPEKDDNEWLSKYYKMDKRHFEVFAKATKSRIVVLSYEQETDRFSLVDLDWREEGKGKFCYSTAIPDFGDDFDFYRTAIFTMAPTAVKIDDFNLVMSDHKGNHFALWIPNEYPDKLHGRTLYHGDDDNAEGQINRRFKKNGTQKRKKIVVDEDSDNDNVDVQIDRRLKKKGKQKRKKIVVKDKDTSAEEEAKEEEKEEAKQQTNQETNVEVNDDATYQLQFQPHFETPKTNLFDDIVLELPSTDDLDGYVEPSGNAENVEAEIPGCNIGNIHGGGINGMTSPGTRSCLTDTATGEYKGSTEWYLVNWLKSEVNFKLWDNPKGKNKTKEEIQEVLAKEINEDGTKNHHMERGRRSKRIGEQINKVLRDMRRIYADVKDAVKNGSTTEQVNGITGKSRYYDLLFPTIEQYLETRWNKEKGKTKKSPKTTQQSLIERTQLLGEEADDQEKAEAVEKNKFMDRDAIEQQRLLATEEFQRKLIAPEIERKVLENEALQNDLQFQNYKRYLEYRQLECSFKILSQMNPVYIVFFPAEQVPAADKEEYEKIYNEWLRKHGRDPNFKF